MKRRPSRNQLTQLRTAALRRWHSPTLTPGAIAARLGIPGWWMQEALKPCFVEVCTIYRTHGGTADSIAETASLPRAFVVYCLRRIHAEATSSRQPGARSQGSWSGTEQLHAGLRGGALGEVRA